MVTVDCGNGVSGKTVICGRHKFYRDRHNTRAFFERTGAVPATIVEVTRLASGHYSVELVRTGSP